MFTQRSHLNRRLLNVFAIILLSSPRETHAIAPKQNEGKRRLPPSPPLSSFFYIYEFVIAFTPFILYNMHYHYIFCIFFIHPYSQAAAKFNLGARAQYAFSLFFLIVFYYFRIAYAVYVPYRSYRIIWQHRKSKMNTAGACNAINRQSPLTGSSICHPHY